MKKDKGKKKIAGNIVWSLSIFQVEIFCSDYEINQVMTRLQKFNTTRLFTSVTKLKWAKGGDGGKKTAVTHLPHNHSS
jgi:hypothetical protein